VILGLSLLFAEGCSGSRLVIVKGKITRDGQPIEVSQTGIIRVTLIPDVPAETQFTTYPTKAQPDGAFSIEKVPVGRYKVAIEQLDPTPREDKLAGAFSVRNTQIVRDVDGKSALAIDLSKAGG